MKKFLVNTLIAINVLIILGMLITGFADLLDPRSWHILSTAGYAFPAFLLANLLMLAIWLSVSKKHITIPILGLIICYVPVTQYCPVHISGDAPIGSLKVMTYNTWGLGSHNINENLEDGRSITDYRREMLQFIASQDCDIVCLQEPDVTGDVLHDVDSIIKPVMQYRDTCRSSNNSSVLIFSKHPILRHEPIRYKSKGNLSAAFFLSVNGKELIVINNHLETNSFSEEEKEHFNDVVKGDAEDGSMKNESKFILRKLAKAAEKRAPQADAVASYISLHKGRSMIVCGDFNDIPISYARRTIAKGLTDCYVSTAFGSGFSYHKNTMYVRIDNVMCSDNIEPSGFHVDKTCALSDHYPIVGWVKWHRR